MHTAIAIREYQGSVLLCLIIMADFLRQFVKGARQPTPKEVQGMIAIAAIVVALLFFYGSTILLMAIYLIPLIVQKWVLVVGFLLGLRETAAARRTGSKGRWIFAVLAWASFLLMADYCIRTGSMSYSID